jgi:hypothetical protein
VSHVDTKFKGTLQHFSGLSRIFPGTGNLNALSEQTAKERPVTGTEENYDKPESGYSVSMWRFEAWTSRIPTRSINYSAVTSDD